MANDLKSSRLEARLPAEVHALLRQAAALQGRSLSDFVVASAREAAERAIADRGVINLSLADQRQFAALLAKPKPLSSALRRAAKRHRRLIEPT